MRKHWKRFMLMFGLSWLAAAATLLADGRVLVIGGTVAQPSDAADLYDPRTRTFTAAARMCSRRAAHSSTLLKDGRVLIAGGAESLESVLRSVEIYDPANNSFTEAGQMQAPRYKHSTVSLDDGRVMILGGSDERDWDGRRQSVEIYDPASGRSQLIAPMNRARFKFPNAVAIAVSGKVIIGGGGRRVEVYDHNANRFVVSRGAWKTNGFMRRRRRCRMAGFSSRADTMIPYTRRIRRGFISRPTAQKQNHR